MSESAQRSSPKVLVKSPEAASASMKVFQVKDGDGQLIDLAAAPECENRTTIVPLDKKNGGLKSFVACLRNEPGQEVCVIRAHSLLDLWSKLRCRNHWDHMPPRFQRKDVMHFGVAEERRGHNLQYMLGKIPGFRGFRFRSYYVAVKPPPKSEPSPQSSLDETASEPGPTEALSTRALADIPTGNGTKKEGTKEELGRSDSIGACQPLSYYHPLKSDKKKAPSGMQPKFHKLHFGCFPLSVGNPSKQS